MPKYNVTIPLHASTWVEVEAKNKQEALDKAFEEAGEPSLCHQCSNDVQIDGIDEEAMDSLDFVEEIED